MLNLRLFQSCIVILVINEILSNTKSSNVCKEGTDTLEMTMETGDVLFAGTDCSYSVLLRNENGLICQQHNLDNFGNDRERNSIDQYRICCPKQFLNDQNGLSMLAFIRLGIAGKHPGPCSDDWFIERVELLFNGRRLLNYTFHSWTSSKRKPSCGLSKVNKTDYIRF